MSALDFICKQITGLTLGGLIKFSDSEGELDKQIREWATVILLKRLKKENNW